MTAKTVGVLGGMGPDATVELMRRVIAATPAHDDIDHIHMIVDNNPKIPSRIRALIDGDGESPVPVLIEMARRLQTAGADFIVIPCNTAHYYHQDIAAACTVPVWHMIDLSAAALAARRPRGARIGLLASRAVQIIGLFDRPFADHGLDLIYPDAPDQDAIMTAIRAVKANALSSAQRRDYRDAARRLAARVDLLLIACSELSVLASEVSDLPVAVADTLDILTDAIVTTAR